MSKPAAGRRVGEKEALSVGTQIRGSAQKLNLVAGLIRGRTAADAMNILAFSKKGMAVDVGKGIVMKRFATRGRGKSTRILKPFSRLRIVVREQEEA
jgi:large subunit ribosomal protein L22